MNTYVRLWYLAEFFLYWKIFQTKVVEEVKAHVLSPIAFLRNHTIYEIMWKNMV